MKNLRVPYFLILSVALLNGCGKKPDSASSARAVAQKTRCASGLVQSTTDANSSNVYVATPVKAGDASQTQDCATNVVQTTKGAHSNNVYVAPPEQK